MTDLKLMAAEEVGDLDGCVRELSVAVRWRLQNAAHQAARVAAELRALRERTHFLRELHTSLGGTAAQLEAIAGSLKAEADAVDQKLLPREPILERVDEEHARRVRMALGAGE